MRKIYTYQVSGYLMKKNAETFEMERNSFVTKATAFSRIKDIETNEDREFFECEIALQYKCDYFELDSFEINN
jgi:hypothetical protein